MTSVIPAKAGIQRLCFSRGKVRTKLPAVYILASKRNGTLYICVTSDLIQRIWQHRDDLTDGVSKTYRTHMLAYFEACTTMSEAILHENQLKKWERNWKLELVGSKP